MAEYTYCRRLLVLTVTGLPRPRPPPLVVLEKLPNGPLRTVSVLRHDSALELAVEPCRCPSDVLLEVLLRSVIGYPAIVQFTPSSVFPVVTSRHAMVVSVVARRSGVVGVGAGRVLGI